MAANNHLREAASLLRQALAELRQHRAYACTVGDRKELHDALIMYADTSIIESIDVIGQADNLTP